MGCISNCSIAHMLTVHSTLQHQQLTHESILIRSIPGRSLSRSRRSSAPFAVPGMLRSASAAVLSSNSSSRSIDIRSNRSYPRMSSNSTIGSNTTVITPLIRPHRRVVCLGLCAVVLVGCALSSLSLMVGHSGSTAVRGRQQTTLKLVVVESQQAQSLPETGAVGSMQQRRQDNSVHDSKFAGSELVSGSSSSDEQFTSATHAAPSAAVAANSAAATSHDSSSSRWHARPQQGQQKQQQAQQQAAEKRTDSHSKAARVASATVKDPEARSAAVGQQELPLPQHLQEKLLQHNAVVPAAIATAAAAAEGSADVIAQDAANLHVLLTTGGEPPAQHTEPQQSHQLQHQNLTAAAGQSAPAVSFLLGQQQQQPMQAVMPCPNSTAAAAATDGVNPDDATSKYIAMRGVPPTRLKHPVWWHGPIWAGSGYGSEAINYVLSLVRTGRLAPADVWVHHHGDNWSEAVVKALATEDKQELEYLQSLPARYRSKRAAVVVCHSVPTNWAFPEPMAYAGAPCPPNPREFGWVYTVGRTMFETDRLPAAFVPRLNAMNEIWVPSEWQRQSFIASGVAPGKLVVVPEGVNTTQFDPARYTAMDLASRAQLVFGKPWETKLAERQQRNSSASASSPSSTDGRGSSISTTKALRQDMSSGGSTAAEVVGSGSNTQPSTQQSEDKETSVSAGIADRLSAAESRATTVDGSAGNPSAPASAAGSSNHGPSDESSSTSSSSSSSNSHGNDSAAPKPFRFISTFKWERRKGWDILLEAYLSEFTAEDDVELYILTKPFDRSGAGFTAKMRAWANHLHSSSRSSNAGSPLAPASRQYKQVTAAAGKFSFVPPLDASATGAARHLQGMQQPLLQQQQRRWQQNLGRQPDRQQCSGVWGSANCSALAAGELGAAGGLHSPAGLDGSHPSDFEGATDSVVGDSGKLEQQAKAHAHEVVLEIKQFLQQLPFAASVPAVTQAEQQQQQQQQQRRRLFGVEGAIAAALAADKAAANGTLQQQQQQQQQQQPSSMPVATDPASAAEAAAVKYPALYVVDSHISDGDFPRFYKAGDTFVLPTRGEGWGRPHVEAMSMALPVISTNWSGITAYLNESVGYPLAVEKLVPVQGPDVIWWFKGLQWAQPSVQHLRQLMRHVYTNRSEAAGRGRAARQLMVDKYSPEPLADLLVKELHRIERAIP